MLIFRKKGNYDSKSTEIGRISSFSQTPGSINIGQSLSFEESSPHKDTPKRQIKTSQSSKRPRKHEYRNIKIKIPQMNNDLDLIYKNKSQKLGLQGYFVVKINPQSHIQYKKKQQVIQKVCDSTWVRQSTVQHNQHFFRASFQLKSRNNNHTPKPIPNVDWTNPKENNYSNTYLNHHLFPSRRQSKMIKQRYYGNSREDQTNSFEGSPNIIHKNSLSLKLNNNSSQKKRQKEINLDKKTIQSVKILNHPMFNQSLTGKKMLLY